MIQVREYALLTCDAVQKPSMDVGAVSAATFDWLLDLQKRWRGDSELLELQNRNCIKLGSYVGYLQSPGGESIEVLPKTHQHCPSEDEKARSRTLLRKMLITALRLKPREADFARLQRMNTPLHEWIITEFLGELGRLVRKGLRFDYQQIEEESRFIRGQLNQVKQSRQTPDRATWFHIRHDIYTPNRIENRLLKTALDYVLKLTQDPDNWRLANELSHQLVSIEPIDNAISELPKWQTGKLMQVYDAIKPWCRLIIEKLNPNFQKGVNNGISLLFPMELLFEQYVAHCLRESLANEAELTTQAKSQHLVEHHPQPSDSRQKWFQLQPDMLLKKVQSHSVLDTKWKLLDSGQANGKEKYNISQGDLYQLFAYGHKYMGGEGNMMLIYPKHAEFIDPLPVFDFSDQLKLWVVPFDCDARQLVGGDWNRAFTSIRCDVEMF